MLLDISGITPKFNRVYIGIFEVFKAVPVLLLLEAKVLSSCTDRFWNTIAGLYSITYIAYQANYIF